MKEKVMELINRIKNNDKTLIAIKLNYYQITNVRAILYYSDDELYDNNINELYDNIDDEDVKAIAKALEKNNTVTYLDIWGNKSDTTIINSIVDLLATNTSLQEFNFNNFQLNYDKMQPLLVCLTKTNNLKKLNLGHNDLGNKESDFIKQCINLTKLYLHNNNLDDKYVKNIVEILKFNKFLIKLDLRENKIGPYGINYLSSALEENSTLLELSLGGNQIGDTGAKLLANMLKKNSTLTLLDLYNCQIGWEGATDISTSLLEHNHTLNALCLYDNQLCDKGATSIAKALEKNSSLKYLVLDNNQIGNDGSIAIEKALNKNNTLIDLYIAEDNDIREKTLYHIEQLLDGNKQRAKFCQYLPQGFGSLSYCDSKKAGKSEKDLNTAQEKLKNIRFKFN